MTVLTNWHEADLTRTCLAEEIDVVAAHLVHEDVGALTDLVTKARDLVDADHDWRQVMDALSKIQIAVLGLDETVSRQHTVGPCGYEDTVTVRWLGDREWWTCPRCGNDYEDEKGDDCG